MNDTITALVPQGTIFMGDTPIIAITRYVPYVYHVSLPRPDDGMPSAPVWPRKQAPRLTDAERTARNAEIVALRQAGHTLADIGALVDLTTERVRQIIVRADRIARKSHTE